MRRLQALALMLLSGCATYRPGSLVESAAANHGAGHSPRIARQIGCVDLMVDVLSESNQRAEWTHSGGNQSRCADWEMRALEVPPRSAVIRFSFGNRCDRPVGVNLASATVRVRYAGASEVPTRRFDPRLEIRPGVLDALQSGSEIIEYDTRASRDPIVELCVSLDGIVSGPSPDEACFERTSVGMVPEDTSEDSEEAGENAEDEL